MTCSPKERIRNLLQEAAKKDAQIVSLQRQIDSFKRLRTQCALSRQALRDITDFCAAFREDHYLVDRINETATRALLNLSDAEKELQV